MPPKKNLKLLIYAPESFLPARASEFRIWVLLKKCSTFVQYTPPSFIECKKMNKKIFEIALNSLPILVMIGLIPIVSDDYVLTLIYIFIITLAFFIKKQKNDIVILIFGFFIMTVSEYLFVSTGVEVFIRNSLFGLMPLWLPFLWAYGFVVIKRAVNILDE